MFANELQVVHSIIKTTLDNITVMDIAVLYCVVENFGAKQSVFFLIKIQTPHNEKL